MTETETKAPAPLSRMAIRGVVGGTLMGMANLVPGISGGTMLLAAGVYPDFIRGIGEVTTLKFSVRQQATLLPVTLAALTVIVLLAGVVRDLVVGYRWAMYSLFIGLTLGGVPIVRELLGEFDNKAKGGAAAGFLCMTALALAQTMGASGVGSNEGMLWMFMAGTAAAGAMILPGVSGGYLLLVLGAYVPILSGIHAFKEALKAGDTTAIMDPMLGVVLPVGVGVVVGIAAVSNALRWFLANHRSATLGALLGLLVGAVVGIYPFQQGVEPQIGDMFKGRALTAETLADVDPEDWPTEFFTPSPVQVGGGFGLVFLGLGLTLGIRKLRGPDEE